MATPSIITDFSHLGWAMIVSFLTSDDQFPLLGLCKSMAESPIRKAFFAQTTWRIPPSEALADKLTTKAAVLRAVKSVQVELGWQQDLLERFPELESVHYVGSGIVVTRIPDRVKTVDFRRACVCLRGYCLGRNVETLSIPSLMSDTCDGCFSLYDRRLMSLTVDEITHRGADLYFKHLPNLRVLKSTFKNDFEERKLLALRHLEELTLYSCGFESNVLLRLAPQLKVLDVSGYIEKSMEARLISSLVNVRVLGLSYTKLLKDDLRLLAGLTHLEELYVSASSSADWTPIARLSKLRVLGQSKGFEGVNEASVRAIEGLPSLRTIKCTKDGGALLERFVLPQLEVLDVTSKRTDPVRFLPGHFAGVRELRLVCEAVDVASLAPSLPRLMKLRLHVKSKNPVDFSALAGLKKLEHLELHVDHEAYTYCVPPARASVDFRLSILRNMTRLRMLNLHDVRLEDAHVLGELKRLRSLDLTGTRVSDLSSLRGHPNLSRLTLPEETDCAALYGPSGVLLPNISEIRHGKEPRCLWRHSWKGEANA